MSEGRLVVEDSAFQRPSATQIRLAGLVALAGYLWLGDVLMIESIVKWETALRDYQQTSPRAVYGVAFAALGTVLDCHHGSAPSAQ